MISPPLCEEEHLQSLIAAFVQKLPGLQTQEALRHCKSEFLGKKSQLKAQFRLLKDYQPAERTQRAELLNRIQTYFEQALKDQKDRVIQQDMETALAQEWADLSLPGTLPEYGAKHPVAELEKRSLALLRQLGFEFVDGPEVEDPYFCFDALNIPPHHPARDLQDTFWVEGHKVLRTHTTSVQARVLSEHPPLPIKVASAGRVYRNEAVDATHTAMFHQIEGFWLDQGITFAHLKGILLFLAKHLLGSQHLFRIKPKYYPYTEPSIGLDVSCTSCRGEGCDACHDNGWITLMGAGMIHRNILTQFGYNPEQVTGLAFGWGTTRIAAQWLQLSNIKSLYEQDIRLFRALKRRSL